MTYLENVYEKYNLMFSELNEIVKESESRVILGQDNFLVGNVNFFVKAYLVNICTYMEALLQEVALFISNCLFERLEEANIPFNFLNWYLVSNYKEKDLKYEKASFKPTSKEINDKLSANPCKTIKLFQLLGVQLDNCNFFRENKETINTIVTKRNNIIHHNDNATDISFGDLKEYIKIFQNYALSIVRFIDEL